MFRIWRSQYSRYGHSPEAENELYAETYTADETYTDAELKYIADGGFNGIWLNMLLHNVVFNKAFPEFGLYARQQQEKLASLIERAAKYGIKVYLCCQPPRAVNEWDKAFWEKHADVSGARDTLSKLWGTKDGHDFSDFISICTSLPKVQKYLEEAFADLSRALPELGGYILITASEFPAHCCTRQQPREKQCPRCSKRTPEEVIAELINCVEKGVHSAAPDQAVIAWNWSWRSSANAFPPDIIRRLNGNVVIMGDAERGGCDKAGTYIDEYAMCYEGPSPIFLEDMAAAEEHKLGTAAKLQLNVTHELASVPNIPVPGQLFARAQWVKHSKNCAGYMGCWNFGNAITANTAAFHFFTTKECPDKLLDALECFAERYFPACNAKMVAQAWKEFGDALEGYPHCTPWLYMGCVNWALGYFCPPGKMNGKGGRSWQYDVRGDDLSAAFAKEKDNGGNPNGERRFNDEQVLERLGRISARWSKALELFEAGLASSKCRHSEEELNTAKVANACFISACNMIKMYMMKKNGGIAQGREYLDIQACELDNVRSVADIVRADRRQGFHSEAQVYMFDAGMLDDKIAKLEDLLKSNK